MKRVFFISLILFGVILTGCREDKEKTPLPDPPTDPIVEPVQPINQPTPVKAGMLLFDGLNAKKNVIHEEDVFPIASESYFVSPIKKSGLKMASYELPEECSDNGYRFKLVAELEAIIVNLEGKPVEVQATHVKIDDKFAYVSYNLREEPNIGGLAVYEYTVKYGTLDEATVDVNPDPVDQIRMPYAQINAIDIDDSKLYLAGATDHPEDFFGKSEREDRAFLMVLELNADGTFKAHTTQEEPVVKQLTSYQATSIRKYKDKIYVTVGDGTDGPPNWNNLMDGGLFVYDANNYKFITFILGLVHARSVDVDDDYVYLYQANHARVSKYSHNDLSKNGKIPLYEDIDEAMQRDAKSEMMVWKNYLFVAENESGLRMLFKDGKLNQAIRPPNFGSDDWSSEKHVTNSMSMNSDPKKDADGKYVQSDLLLVANGEQGISWYDITKPINNPNGKDWIYSSSTNKVLDGKGSANYVTSRGNVVFVADGMGGLKVLFIGFNSGEAPPPDGVGCDEFMGYVYNGEDNVSPLFPETYSVFRESAHPIVKQLFQLPTREEAASVVLNYIEITNATSLYITYHTEGAGYNNALGYFVIPADVPKDDKAEYEYWDKFIKPDMTTTSRNVLKDEYIIFNYVREEGDRNGTLIPGGRYEIGNGRIFQPGERVVLFMCPDGWKPQNNRVEVTYTSNIYYQINFMHKYFNKVTNINYSPIYSAGSDSFAGVQFNSFYSADCKSMVLLIEDNHSANSDVDFNDVILSITDNRDGEAIKSFVAPKWAVGKDKDNGDLYILPIEKILN